MPPTLLACGSNGSAQLGIGHADDVSTFTECKYDPACPAIAEVLDVVSAASHALLLVRDEEGKAHLLGAGTNTHGQLGRKCALNEGPPKAMTSFRPLSITRDAGLDNAVPVKIAATWTTSFVAFDVSGGAEGDSNAKAKTQQVIVSTGSNDFGELGGGIVRARPGERVEHLRGGQRHVLAVFTRGEGPSRKQRVVGWGAARRGELDPKGTHTAKGKGRARAPTATPTDLDLELSAPIADIALGASHTVLLLEDGHVLAWGNDLKGQVAGLRDVTAASAIGASWNGTYVLADSTLWSQGSNTHGQLLRAASDDSRGPIVLDGITAFVAGSEHILAVVPRPDGTPELWAGGWNEHGNLGVGDEIDRSAPVCVNAVRPRRVWAGCAASWVLADPV